LHSTPLIAAGISSGTGGIMYYNTKVAQNEQTQARVGLIITPIAAIQPAFEVESSPD
jgi:hypothetical protein